MAESTTTRLGIHRWSAGTDTFQRSELDDSFAQLEALTAIYKQGTFAGRPAAGTVGTFYHDTTNVSQWYDTGSAWVSVGAKPFDAVATASAAGTVPLTALGATSQTADLFQAKVGSTVFFKVDSDGDTTTANGYNGQYLSLLNTVNAQVPLFVKGAAAQSADLVQVQNNAGTNRFKVTAAGAVQSTYLVSGDSQGVIGNSSASTVANMTSFGGTPVLEMYSQNGGASGTFTDFAYLHHVAADSTAVSRRLGLLMKVGAETVGDAAKTGALYLESSAALFASPSLILARADAPVMTFPAGADAKINNNNLGADGYFQSLVTSGKSSFLYGDSVAGHGMQGSNIYERAGANSGIYYYSGGTHSDSPGNAGTGGVVLAQLLRNGSAGQFITNQLRGSDSATLPSSSPGLQVGPSNSKNLQFNGDTLQAVNNGVVAALKLNTVGGALTLGKTDLSGRIEVYGGPTVVKGNLLVDGEIYSSTSGTAEVWHNVTFANGWSNNPSGHAVQYRFVVSPALSIEIFGEMLPGTLADNTVVFSVPYNPPTIVSFFARRGAGQICTLQLNPNGDVKIFDASGGSSLVIIPPAILPLD